MILEIGFWKSSNENISIVKEAIIFENKIGRIRDIKIHPDTGKIYLLSENALWMIKRVIFGSVTNERINQLDDINKLESIPLGLLALTILILGVWPKPLIDLMNQSINLLTLVITGT